MPYPQIVEYNEAVQNPAEAFVDWDLKRGTVRENTLGLPLVLSGGFALTYTVQTPQRKSAVRCFHKEIPAIEQKYRAISKALQPLANGYFVNFDFQQAGIKVANGTFPIVRMDWVEGDPLGVWLDKNYQNPSALEATRKEFVLISSFLEQRGIAHGDIQNGNVMISNGRVRLIDYDGMFVPGMNAGNGTETGHKHFQHPDRKASDFGPKMDRFSFISLELSLLGVIADKSLYPKYREGGETIIFSANDFADPSKSEIFRLLTAKPNLKDYARNFAAVCQAPLSAVPSLDDFLAARNIPAVKPIQIRVSPTAKPSPSAVAYISAHPVVDALDFGAALKRVGDRIELVGKIVEVKHAVGRRGRGRGKPYVFLNFGPWRGNIVKISIWSEGLAQLTEQPSAAWVNRWVSVVGLMDPPYDSGRYGYRHLSVTVEKDGQIHFLDEVQARFRLGSPQANAPKTRDTDGRIVKPRAPKPRSSSPKHSAQATKPLSVGGRARSRNADIVTRYTSGPRAEPTGGYNPPSVSQPRPSLPSTSKGWLESVPSWVWFAAAVVLLILLLNSGG